MYPFEVFKAENHIRFLGYPVYLSHREWCDGAYQSPFLPREHESRVPLVQPGPSSKGPVQERLPSFLPLLVGQRWRWALAWVIRSTIFEIEAWAVLESLASPYDELSLRDLHVPSAVRGLGLSGDRILPSLQSLHRQFESVLPPLWLVGLSSPEIGTQGSDTSFVTAPGQPQTRREQRLLIAYRFLERF